MCSVRDIIYFSYYRFVESALAGENAARFGVDDNLVKAMFRLLIELNKVEQRERR